MNAITSENELLDTKNIVITGANSGIGYFTALNIAKMKHTVIMVCRNEKKALESKNNILKKIPDANLDVIIGDLSSIAKVQDLITDIQKKYDTIDVLIHNAGIWQMKKELNEDGLELSFMVNYLAMYILNKNLLSNLLRSADPRIILVSADLYDRGEFDIEITPYGKKFSRVRTYADSKLCGLLYMKKFQEELPNDQKNKLLINAIHPGVFRTNLGITHSILGGIIKGVKILMPSAKKSWKGITYLAVDSDKDQIGNGKYYYKMKIKELHKKVEDQANQEQLWKFSNELTQKYLLNI